jgi:hypothetical protein
MVLAQVGLSCIIARYHESEKLERFRSIKPEHVTSFLEALQGVNNLPEREQDGANGFLWEEDEAARTIYRTHYQYHRSPQNRRNNPRDCRSEIGEPGTKRECRFLELQNESG